MVTFGLILLSLLALLGLLVFSVIYLDLQASERAARLRVRWLGARLTLATGKEEAEFGLFSLKVRRRLTVKEGRLEKPKPRQPKREVSLGERLEQASVFMRAGACVLRHIRLQNVNAQATVATSDPALTGELFGYASILKSTLAPWVSLSVTPDFCGTTPRAQLSGTLSIRVVYLLVAAWRVGKTFLFKGRGLLHRAKGVSHATSRAT